MVTDPVIGSFVWTASSLAFLAGGTALVRALATRDATRLIAPAETGSALLPEASTT